MKNQQLMFKKVKPIRLIAWLSDEINYGNMLLNENWKSFYKH